MKKRKPEALSSAEFPVDPIDLLRAATALEISNTYYLSTEEINARLAKVNDRNLADLLTLEIQMGQEFKANGESKRYYDLYDLSLTEEEEIERQIGARYPAGSDAGFKDHQVAGAIPGALLRLSDEIISQGILAGAKTKKSQK